MKRGRVVLSLAVIAGSLGWVAANGLADNLVYYSTPSELLRKGAAAVDEQVRLGGYVLPGSVREGRSAVRFVITDGTTRMSVIGTGGAPALFAGGRGVVVEGSYGRDGAFHADTVLVKHDNVYRPPSPNETPTTADLEG